MGIIRTCFAIAVFFCTVECAAQVQFVNNSPDPTLAELAIEIGGKTVVPSLGYRRATSFIQTSISAGDSIEIVSAAKPSIRVTLPFLADASAPSRVVVQGFVNSSGFASNPDGRDVALSLFTQNVLLDSEDPDDADIAAIFGCTDAPSLSLTVVDVAPLIRNGSFGDGLPFTIPMPADEYSLALVGEFPAPEFRRKFAVDLRDVRGKCAALLLSGFWNPATNNNGLPLALLKIVPDGSVTEYSVLTGVWEDTEVHSAAVVITENEILWDNLAVHSIEVYSSIGQLLKKSTSGDCQISAFGNGNYRIKINGKNGNVFVKNFTLCR